MSSYLSGFSHLIEQYEKYQKASDSWSDHAYGLNIRYFDRYCALYYPGQPLCQEMVDEWCRKRETETNTSCLTRTGGIRSFIRYLRDRGLTTVEPAKPPKPEGKIYIPHAFTDQELRKFFNECDRIVPLRPELKYRMKKITCPVFFRLLYSSGIRTTEARYLKREDVDLEHGVLNIRKSKGYDQHYIALHKSMTELLKQYNKVAESIRPDRTYFFETPNGKYYSRQWVTQTFQCLWEKANGEQNKAVAYDLRHNYAATNIDRWADDTFEFNQKLHYLSKSMGHRSIESTLYYYSITPCLADILLKKTENSFNELLPEVRHEENG